MPIYKPIESKSLAESVAEQLMAMIAKGELKQGDRLPTEPELMEHFNVGRSTLREAVKSLVVAGLLETRRSSGTFVSDSYTDYLGQSLNWGMVFGAQEVRHVLEIRYALEGQAAELAAERATDHQKENLAQLVDAISNVNPRLEKAIEHDVSFHVAVAESSHNPLLLSLISNIRKILYGYIKSGYTRRGYINQVDASEMANLHRPIMEAIQAGQPENAKIAMQNHFKNTTGWRLTHTPVDEDFKS